MSGLFRRMRENWMYWRFRNITRNRMRLQSWWNRRRSGSMPYRPRASAQTIYSTRSRRSLIAFAALILLLTALTSAERYVYISPPLGYGLGTLIVVGSLYWALRGI
jgi:hypothetical protein